MYEAPVKKMHFKCHTFIIQNHFGLLSSLCSVFFLLSLCDDITQETIAIVFHNKMRFKYRKQHKG